MTDKLRILVVGGTRPEAIKLAPVIRALTGCADRIETVSVSTGQHDSMFREAFGVFGLRPDIEMRTPWPQNDLHLAVSSLIARLGELLRSQQADYVLVQGDTTSAFAGALAALYHRIPVAHVEAGLRSGNRYLPFPEEMNTRLITDVAQTHFAPTSLAREHLLREGVSPEHIIITGNTVIDALEYVKRGLPDSPLDLYDADFRSRVILASAHRREHFGDPLRRICRALLRVVERNPDITLLYSLHPNPLASQPAADILGRHPRVRLLPALAYPEFVRLMMQSYVIVTDSSGIQEEAPSLAKPVLVLRDVTERTEGVEAGVARLIGTDESWVAHAVQEVLDDPNTYRRMTTAINPYGDGRASERIVSYFQAIAPAARAEAPVFHHG